MSSTAEKTEEKEQKSNVKPYRKSQKSMAASTA
jgi:hypothetical protein